MWPSAVLITIVVGILAASHQPRLQRLFTWLPTPLWCYALPLVAVSLGWLPSGHPSYRSLTSDLLPIALGMLLLGVDLSSIARAGGRALIAAVAGAVGVILGTPLSAWVLHRALPADAWKGAGTLAGTWTGGTMNLLALRTLLDTPETMFAPLIVVDAVVAYSWMALLVAASGYESSINRWLGASTRVDASPDAASEPHASGPHLPPLILCLALTGALTLLSRGLGAHLPVSNLISSPAGWTIFLVTTASLGCSLMPSMRRIGAHGAALGYPLLYVVLAATGAQASLAGLRSAPAWIGVGALTLLLHGGLLVIVGRMLRIPLGLLATASQANIGGMVSAPLVGAVYHRSLAPVGLLLAMVGNALGTYLGLVAASLSRMFLT